jgi:putative ABC transport system permease protein
VLPPELRFPDERAAFWMPLPVSPATARPGGFGPNMIARVAAGTDLSNLESNLQPLARSVQQRIGGPAPYAEIMERHRPVVRSLREQLVGRITTPLWIMSAAVGIVFLIACANVANLFALRAESRTRDLAIRRALGAGRARLVRAQMAEALLIAAAGGIGGALVAWAAVPVLVRWAPASVGGGYLSPPIPGLAAAGLDPTTLIFAASASVLAAFVFGLLPAVHFSAAVLDHRRKAGWNAAGRRSAVRHVLVVLQTASALVLLVGSALLARSFWQLTRVDTGYQTENIFTFQTSLNRGELIGDHLQASISNFQHAFMERLAGLPDVESVAYVTHLPLDEGARDGFFTTPAIEASGAESPRIRVAGVGGPYFQTMGIDLLGGRYFHRVEEQQFTLNAILSVTAAELLFPGEDPVGQRFQPVDFPGGPGSDTWYTVVGLVEDVLLDDLRRESPEPIAYMAMATLSPAFVVRSPRAEELAPQVREVIREVAPNSPMFRTFTMEELAARSMASLSFTMLMVGIAAALALILGAVGIYGVLSYVVARRTREIAVRMALGEQPQRIRRMVVFQGGRVTLLGIAIGVVAALLLTRFLESLLYGVSPLDLPSFAVMLGLILAVALLASYLPARRASSVDPGRALRAD